MKKFLRRFFKFTGITLVVLLLIIILIPILFGSQIKEAVKGYINDEINATVYFEDVGISVFSNFPNLTVSLDKFGVIGKDEFEGDTLADIEQFGVVVNLMSLLGDKYEVGKITLDHPTIHAKVNKAGKANWDIMKESGESDTVTEVEEADSSESAPLALELSSYSLVGGNIIFDDRASDIFAEIVNLNHKGSGNFEGDNYDFDTYTSTDEITVVMEGTHYLNKTKIDAELVVNIDNAKSKYTLKNNRIGVNALDLHFDGFIAMPGDDIDMDLTFNTNQNKFSQILSMVPGMYTEDFSDLETEGTFKLDGNVKGVFNENKIPGFTVNLSVKDGFFHYPDLPESVKDINFSVKTTCPDGDLNKLGIDMPNFHALFGKNPIDARCVLSGLMTESYNIDANAKAKLDLAQLSTMFPMEGMEMKGSFVIDGGAKGIYNEAKGSMPKVDATMQLKNGYFKTADFPSAISNMSMDAEMKSVETDLSTATLNVKQFHGEIDGDPIDAHLTVSNFDNPNYDLTAKGLLNLSKLGKILEMDKTTLEGLFDFNLTTKGNLAAIEAEKYSELPTSGSMKLSNFKYASPDFPQGLNISKGELNFNPQKLDIPQIVGKVGSSPIVLSGYLDNYLSYVLLPNQEIKGQMSLASSRFNVNEWMEEDPSAPAATTPTTAPEEDVDMEAFEVPAGVDFVFNCNVTRALYDNLTLDNVKGKLIMRDQKVTFENMGFHTLGGTMNLNGSYSTTDPASPDVNLDMRLVNLDIAETWKTMEIVQAIAPAGKFMSGKVNSTLNLKGKLLSDMSPDLASITSVGDMKIFNGTLKGFKAMDMVANKIKLNKLKELKLSDTKILYEVRDGKIWVEPFDIPMGKGKMVVDGNHGIDQQMAYNLALDLPAGAAGTAALSAVGGLIGKDMGEQFKVNVGLGGTVDKPKITYVKNEKGDGAKDVVEDKIEDVKEEVVEKIEDVKEEVKVQVDDAKEKAKAEADKIIREAEAQAAKIRSEAKKQAQKLRSEANKQADQIEKSAKNPFEKAAKKKLAQKTRQTGDKAARKVETEADGKAKKLVDDAKKRADAMIK